MIIPGTNVEYNPTLESTTHRVDELKPEVVYGLKRKAKYLVFLKAREAYPKGRLIVRDMTPQDLEETNNEWTDTISGADDWEAHQIENVTIDPGRFVVIFGCRMMQFHVPDDLPVAALKFTVGASEVARWDLYKAYAATEDTYVAANAVQALMPPSVIAESPIVIPENMVITISQWGQATTLFCLALEGYVCELEGKTLKP